MMAWILLAAALAVLPADCAAQFGCSTRANLAAMVAEPEDLRHGRVLVPAQGGVALDAVERLRLGKPLPLPGAGAADASGTPQ